MNSFVKIYTLHCPFTEEIKYVGQTIQSLEMRLGQHVCNPTGKKMAHWISTLSGTFPKIQELDTVESQLADEIENYWIAQLKAWGFPLLNGTVIKSPEPRIHITVFADSAFATDINSFSKQKGLTLSDTIIFFTKKGIYANYEEERQKRLNSETLSYEELLSLYNEDLGKWKLSELPEGHYESYLAIMHQKLWQPPNVNDDLPF